MSKHTPGPWFIDTSLHVYGQAEPQPIKDFPGGLSVTCPHICTANTVANARLIAAAPLMLEALEMADELIDQLIIDNTDNYAEERAKIRAAIAAAKGEA